MLQGQHVSMSSNISINNNSVSQYYYSIKDISVGGMCICYGHAQSCPLDLVTKVTCSTCTLGHLFTSYLCTCLAVHLF